MPVTIYLPANVPPAKAVKLERWGAKVVWEGEVWDDANAAALAAAEREGMTYVHPFADPEVMAGQGTLALEALDDAPGDRPLRDRDRRRRPDRRGRHGGEGEVARRRE